MNDFEIRYNAVEHANLLVLQELVRSVAKLHDNPTTWIKEFEGSVSRKIEATKNQDGTPRDQRLTEVAKSVVQAVSQMAAHEL